MFSDTLDKCRDQLSTGAKVVVTVEATMESEQLKLLARSVAPIDSVVADVGGAGLKVFVEEKSAISTVATVLRDAPKTGAGRGPIVLCLMAEGLPGEVEIDLNRDFPVSPQIKGAIKSLPGVLMVEDF